MRIAEKSKFFFKEQGIIQYTLLPFNETQMICKDFSAMPHLGANEALSTELVRIDLLFNKRERNDC